MKKIKSLLILILIIQIVFSITLDYNVYAENKLEENQENESVIENKNDEFDDYEKYSEEYKEYLKLSDEEKAKIAVIPEKYNISIKEFESVYHEEDVVETKKRSAKSEILDTGTLDNSYDMRDDITIKVEDQGKENICWTFASLGALRTYLAKKGYNNKTTPDFSERHMDYLTSKYYSKGSGRELGSGGYFSYAIKYFKYNDGPIAESTLPYNTSIDVNSSTELEKLDNYKSTYYVHEVINFPTITKKLQSNGDLIIYNGDDIISESDLTSVRNKIKRQIKNNGGLYCSMRVHANFACKDLEGKKSYFDDGSLTKEIAESNGSKIRGHAVTIIGWDDNYSKDNFEAKNANGTSVKPKNDGAYLVLNSQGTDWNSGGYFWISYDDYGVERALSGIVSADNTENYYTYTFNNQLAYNGMKEMFNPLEGDITITDSTKTIKLLDLIVNNDIKSLNGLNNLQLTDDDLKIIFKYEFPIVTSLNLNDNLITDLSLINCPNLEKLYIANNNIQDLSPIYKYGSELELLSVSSNNISNVGVLSALSNIKKLYLGQNQIENVNPLKMSDYEVISISNQSINKALQNSLTYTYPSIITYAKNSSNKLYSSSGLTFVNCKENDNGNGIVVTNPNASQIYVKINEGSASGTKINFNVIDTEAPELTVSEPPQSWVNSSNITIRATDSISGLKSVTVNGQAVTLTNGQATLTANENGTYIIVATDNFNNTTSKTVVVNNIDRYDPTLTVTGNATSWTDQNVLLTIKAEDTESGLKSVTVNGQAVTLTNGQATFTANENGTYTIVATDNVGRTKTVTENVNKIDKTDPTLTVTGNATSWTDQNVLLTIKAEDTESGLKSVTVNGQAVTLANGQATFTANENGTYTIVATDNAGRTKTEKIVIDKIIKTVVDNAETENTVVDNAETEKKVVDNAETENTVVNNAVEDKTVTKNMTRENHIVGKKTDTSKTSDLTTSTKELADTGKIVVLEIILVMAAIVMIVSFIKYNEYKKIK